MSDSCNRRKFLKRVAVTCSGVAGASITAVLIHDKGRDEPLPQERTEQVRDFSVQGNSAHPQLVIAKGAPFVATNKAIESLGGMAYFVKPGESVVIKPNVGWDRTPVHAANTNPIVVATIVELCFKAGAASVIVTDHSCNDPRRCFTRSGIWKAAAEAGAEVVLPAPHRFRMYDLGGVVLGRIPVLMPAVQADRFINVPVAKHHGFSGFSGAMKNLYGILGGRRNRLHQKINDSIADLADFVRPTLTVMDATRVMFRNGPQGGDLADTRAVGQIIASTDQVAVDAYSCGLIGLSPEDLPFLALAQSRGLGTADLNQIKVKEV